MQWIKHAFAIEDPRSTEPNERQRAIIERLCREIVRRRLTTPALIALETGRPLNLIGAQALHFLSPLISALTDTDGHRQLAEFLEHRGSVDFICRRIEEMEQAESGKAAAAK